MTVGEEKRDRGRMDGGNAERRIADGYSLKHASSSLLIPNLVLESVQHHPFSQGCHQETARHRRGYEWDDPSEAMRLRVPAFALPRRLDLPHFVHYSRPSLTNFTWALPRQLAVRPPANNDVCTGNTKRKRADFSVQNVGTASRQLQPVILERVRCEAEQMSCSENSKNQ